MEPERSRSRGRRRVPLRVVGRRGLGEAVAQKKAADQGASAQPIAQHERSHPAAGLADELQGGHPPQVTEFGGDHVIVDHGVEPRHVGPVSKLGIEPPLEVGEVLSAAAVEDPDLGAGKDEMVWGEIVFGADNRDPNTRFIEGLAQALLARFCRPRPWTIRTWAQAKTRWCGVKLYSGPTTAIRTPDS